MADFGDSTHTVPRLSTGLKNPIKLISLVGCAKPPRARGCLRGSSGLGVSFSVP